MGLKLPLSKPTTVLLVKTSGLIIAVVGLFILFRVVWVTWDLFDDHTVVHQFADQINEYLKQIQVKQLSLPGVGDAAGKLSTIKLPPMPLPISYLLAWMLVLALLWLLGKFGIAILLVGGKLALASDSGEEHIRTLVTELVEEIREGRSGGEVVLKE